MDTVPSDAKPSPSAWAPFAHRSFAVLWVATVLSNIGTWMHDVGAGWLMTELSPSPVMVSAVQAATTLPIFLFALLAGAVADIVDRRKLLIGVNLFLAANAATLATLVSLDLVTPLILILFTFALGTGAAFVAPAWQAVVPGLVPREDLPAAIALNSMGINVSRAIGPALAGFLIVGIGLWSPFALNSVSFIGIIAALLWWRPPVATQRTLPAEEVGSAIINGLRYARHSAPLRATLIRALAFFVFASAFWAMLPLVVRVVLSGGPTLYGLLLTSVGIGAVTGALILPRHPRAIRRKPYGCIWDSRIGHFPFVARSRADTGCGHLCSSPRRLILDLGPFEPQPRRTNVVARLGARPGALDFPDSLLRSHVLRQSALGPSGQQLRRPRCPPYRGLRSYCDDTADMAVATDPQRRARAGAVHALAGSHSQQRKQSHRQTRDDPGRLHGRSAKSRAVLEPHEFNSPKPAAVAGATNGP